MTKEEYSWFKIDCPICGNGLREQPKQVQGEPKEWVGLSDEDDIDWEEGDSLRDLFKAIDAKLKERNT